MENMDLLIEITMKLSQTLESMAANERQFGWDISHVLDQLSYDTLIVANNLREINNQFVGGVA